jgi:hypothetical protein
MGTADWRMTPREDQAMRGTMAGLLATTVLAGCGADPSFVLIEPGTEAIVRSDDAGRPIVPLDRLGGDDIGPIPAGTRVRVVADSASPKARDDVRKARDDPARDVVALVLEGDSEGETVLLRRSDVRPLD